jgi:archaeosine synthase
LKTNLYNKISTKVGKGVKIKKALCFYNPEQVYKGLQKNPDIKKWHNFITNKYSPPKKEVLLIYPCSTVKPYNESRSYKLLYHSLDKLNGQRDKIQVMTISEPFGLVPEEYYSKFVWYDCPGLFEWWCNKHGQQYDKEYLDKSITILADKIGKFLKKSIKRKKYKKILAFVRTYSSSLGSKDDHTHRRMLEEAARKYDLDIEIFPTKSQIKKLIKKHGSFAWDMYGVAHPEMQKQLLKKLQKI